MQRLLGGAFFTVSFIALKVNFKQKCLENGKNHRIYDNTDKKNIFKRKKSRFFALIYF